ncbi:hypothetical protein HHO41_18290 [Bacillus sp. DNRA2]|uniref:hypothetical protein n=1 Tax=Bacillus sp. DNRA2 TaxID=2723053 RepID=UPI00145EF964|nr:hypothetical protein [Bacillus sp. DNRA2]NMD72224.1 hypothetical protein [Bacillus sp. DNRA2]
MNQDFNKKKIQIKYRKTIQDKNKGVKYNKEIIVVAFLLIIILFTCFLFDYNPFSNNLVKITKVEIKPE